MNASESKFRFERLVEEANDSVPLLTVSKAVRHMIEFYRSVKAIDCDVDEDGDMLLFQCGLFRFDSESTYQYDLTRQFITSGSEDDGAMSQLSLTLHFEPTEVLEFLKPDSHWCGSPAETTEFEAFIRNHEASHAITNLQPLRVSLAWNLT